MCAKKLLVVDDDEMIRNSVTKLSKRHGLECDAAESIDKAIELASKDPALYTYYMIDLNIPDNNNGYILADKLKQICGSSLGKLILMTGDSIPEAEYKAHGFIHTIVKPVKKSDFENMLKDL